MVGQRSPTKVREVTGLLSSSRHHPDRLCQREYFTPPTGCQESDVPLAHTHASVDYNH